MQIMKILWRYYEDYEDSKILDDMNMIWDEDYEDYEDSRWYEYDMNCSRMGI